jgi:sRNA-binding carbon storage regulator CsrA
MLALSRRIGQSVHCGGGGVDVLFTYQRPTRDGVVLTMKRAGSPECDLALPIGVTARIGEIEIQPQWATPHKTRLGFEAPSEVRIMRTELLNQAKGTER